MCSSSTRTMFRQTTRLLSEARPPTPSAEQATSQSTRVRWCWIQLGEPSACSSSISTPRQKLRLPRRATCLPAVSAELRRPTEVNWLPFSRKTNMSARQICLAAGTSSSRHNNVNVKLKSHQREHSKMRNLSPTFDSDPRGIIRWLGSDSPCQPSRGKMQFSSRGRKCTTPTHKMSRSKDTMRLGCF